MVFSMQSNLLKWPFLLKDHLPTTVSLPADVLWGSFVMHSFLPRGGEMNALQTNPKGRLRGGYTTVTFLADSPYMDSFEPL